jgi:hemerythrin-like domain-containing protein|tara:strand:+ start:769 stop:1044 length:276 start_codon:yes stop_codon:yes gene_type:complete
MNVSKVIEAGGIGSVYINYVAQLQIEVEGGTINIDTDHDTLRRLARVINDKIKRQDEEAAEDLKETLEKAAKEAAESEGCCESEECCQSES